MFFCLNATHKGVLCLSTHLLACMCSVCICSIPCSCVIVHVGVCTPGSARSVSHPAASKHIISGVRGLLFSGRGDVSGVCSEAGARLNSSLCNKQFNSAKVQLSSVLLICSSLHSQWKTILYFRPG